MAMRNRKAYTLLETIVLGVVSVTLFAASGRVLQTAYRTHRHSLDHLASSEVLHQVFNRLYQDASRSADCAVERALVFSVAKKAGEKVRYQANGRQLERIRYQELPSPADTEASIDFLAREVWRLPENMQIQWQINTDTSPSIVVVSLRNEQQPRVIQWKFQLEEIQ